MSTQFDQSAVYMSLGGYVVDLEQVGKQMCFFIIPCQAAALKQCLSPLYLYTFPFFLPDKIPNFETDDDIDADERDGDDDDDLLVCPPRGGFTC